MKCWNLLKQSVEWKLELNGDPLIVILGLQTLFLVILLPGLCVVLRLLTLLACRERICFSISPW